jgi:hypothetical protein
MSYHLKLEYLEILRSRYAGASKISRSQIIDEFCRNTGMHRKSAIRCLRSKMKGRRTGSGRKKRYSVDAIYQLRKFWIKAEQMCSKKIKHALPFWLDKAVMTAEVKHELLRMSPSTMDRYLKPFRAQTKRRWNTGTKPSKLLKNIVPIKTLSNIPARAGFIEADTVAHCGGSLLGEFIWSLTFTDVFSGWTENRAVWGKHAVNVHAAIQDIEASLPFEIIEFNVDNGSEFLNHRLVEYFQPGGPHLRRQFVMTRSRSYHKNDNAHVEQKNWTHVRQIFGYERFEFKELLPMMNEVYQVQNMLTNFFIPQMKLKSKVRVGAKIKKKYDTPQTPYHRLLADPSVTEENKNKLKEQYEKLNPFKLVELREALLADFYKHKKQLQLNKEAATPPSNVIPLR